jgi:FkbH-like protein
LSEEDSKKSLQYKANIERNRLRKNFSLESFIKGLNITLSVHVRLREFVSRLSQMTKKTNQFNLVTNRYSEAEMQTLLDDEDYQVYGGSYQDRFGKEGMTIMAIVSVDGTIATIEDFLMSCRILGRDVEYAFLRRVLEMLQERGVVTIRGLYRQTRRNVPCRDFYRGLGMETVNPELFVGSVQAVLTHLWKRDLSIQVTSENYSKELI